MRVQSSSDRGLPFHGGILTTDGEDLGEMLAHEHHGGPGEKRSEGTNEEAKLCVGAGVNGHELVVAQQVTDPGAEGGNCLLLLAGEPRRNEH